MKSLFILFALSFSSYASGQTLSSGIGIFDTRAVDDLPGFNTRSIRADFKEMKAIGVPGTGTYSTSITVSPWIDASGGYNHQLNFNDGGIYYRQGKFDAKNWGQWSRLITEQGGQVSIGSQVSSTGFGTVSRLTIIPYRHTGGPWSFKSRDINLFAFLDFGYGPNNVMTFRHDMMVGIKTKNPLYPLDVNGTIHAKEVLVDTNFPLADYVFKPDYQLMPLDELEQFVQANKHLPEIPSAAEVAQDGLNLGEMQNRLLQKIEELTLYVIKQNKEIEALKRQLNDKQ